MALAEDPHQDHPESDEPDEDWVPEDTFATRLILTRRQLGLNQEDAATRCSVNPKTWATWELGANPRGMHEIVDAIHRELGVSREWLMWGSTRSRCFCKKVPCECGGITVIEHPGQLELPIGIEEPRLALAPLG